MNIILDDREHHLIKLFGDLAKVKRLEFGDIQINFNDIILAIIERKTLTDQHASILDGRHRNKENLLKLREEYKVDIYYLVEGDLHNFEHPSVISSIFNLHTRDNIKVLTSRNLSESKWCILNLMVSYSKHKDAPISHYGSKILLSDECKGLGKIIKKDETIHNMWRSIDGIGDKYARILEANFSIRNFLEGAITSDKMKKLKLRCYKGLSKIGTETIVKILTCISGISRNKAEKYVKNSCDGSGLSARLNKDIESYINFRPLGHGETVSTIHKKI